MTGSLSDWGCWNAAWSVPTASGITQARKRLGRDVMPEIFEGVAEAVATADTRGRGCGSGGCWPLTGSRSTWPIRRLTHG